MKRTKRDSQTDRKSNEQTGKKKKKREKKKKDVTPTSICSLSEGTVLKKLGWWVSPSVREARVAEGLMMGSGILRMESAVSSAVELREGPTMPARDTESIGH